METTAVTPVKRGAPTTYDPAYCDKLIEFFENAPVVEPPNEYQESGRETGTLKRDVRVVCATVPTFERFAAIIGTTTMSMIRWAKQYEDFGEAYARAKQAQANFFVQGLSQGIMNPTGAIFVAKNILGWKDKTEIEQVSSQDTTDAGNMREALAHMTPEELSAVGNALRNAQARRALQPAEPAA